jgi:acetyl-CoA carboxylase carboxyltransferase component
MSWQKEVEEIELRKRFAEELGGAPSIERQHAQGRLTARERIDRLADPGSWFEIGSLTGKAEYDEHWNLKKVRPANAIIGTARIGGRKVSLDIDDFTVRGGSSDATVSDKWIYAENYALEHRLPLVRLVESAGGSVRLVEQMGGTKIPGYPTWLMAGQLGVIPVVAIALGPCAGLGAVKAACAHFSIMVKGTSQVMAGGPPVVERAGMGDELDKNDLGGSHIHTRSGVIDNEAESEEHAFELARKFLSYVPDSVYELPPRVACDDPVDRREEALLSIIPPGLPLAPDSGPGLRQGLGVRNSAYVWPITGHVPRPHQRPSGRCHDQRSLSQRWRSQSAGRRKDGDLYRPVRHLPSADRQSCRSTGDRGRYRG